MLEQINACLAHAQNARYLGYLRLFSCGVAWKVCCSTDYAFANSYILLTNVLAFSLR